MTDTIVFLGPSLDLQQAQQVLPNACFHPPIQCGDMVNLLKLNPKRMIIIDGLYENTPAVWHKEILYALEQGVEVIGAASMGALRAAEMSYYGMKGVGQIYQWFESGELEDDDEVAVLHHGEQRQFSAINDAMVNIRATLKKAVAQDITDDSIAAELIELAKETFYPNRQLRKLIKKHAKQKDCSHDDLMAWLDDNYIDQKRLDAHAVLEWARDNAYQKPTCREMTNQSRFFKRLLIGSSLRPIAHELEWLPENEKAHQAFGNDFAGHYLYDFFYELAFMMMMADKIGHENQSNHDLSALDAYIAQNGLANVAEYFDENAIELVAVRQWVTERVCQLNLKAATIDKHLPLAKLIYVNQLSKFDTKHESLLRLKVILLFCFESLLEEKKLLLNSDSFLSYLQIFRSEVVEEHGKEAFFNWLAANNTALQDFSYFTLIYARYRYAFKGFLASFLIDDHTLCDDQKSWLGITLKAFHDI